MWACAAWQAIAGAGESHGVDQADSRYLAALDRMGTGRASLNDLLEPSDNVTRLAGDLRLALPEVLDPFETARASWCQAVLDWGRGNTANRLVPSDVAGGA
jgi:hypothetical protein